MSKDNQQDQQDKKSTSSQLSIKESVSDDSDDSYIDPMREPGAPYPPDTDSDEEEDIELPQWMGPVKLDFPPKVLVGAYQFYNYERCKKLNKERKRDPDNFVWPNIMQEWVDMSKENKQPFVDEYRAMKQNFRDQWEMEKMELDENECCSESDSDSLTPADE